MAQLVEQRSPKPRVGGSSPSWSAIFKKIMNAKTEKNSSFDTIKLLIAITILVGGIVGYYHFIEYETIYRVLGLLAAVALAILFVFQTAKGKALWHFTGASKAEVRKVVWPTRQETIQTTLVIMVVVLITSVFLWGVDSVLGVIVKSITNA